MSIKYTRNKRRLLFAGVPFLLIFILITLLPSGSADADIGPKPSMEFEFEYETSESLEILDGLLYECDLPDCSDAEPLEELGPQGFRCSEDSCSSMAYGYRDYHRLLIRFSDGKERESNIFQSNSFNTTFHVLVRENDLVVEKVRDRSNPFGLMLIWLFLGGIIALILGFVLLILLVLIIIRAGEEKADFISSRWIFISLWLVMGILLVLASLFSIVAPITVAIEAILGLLYAVIRNRSKVTTLTMIILVNMITLLPLWVATNFVNRDLNTLVTVTAEIIIWIAESLILFLTQRKRIRFSEAALLSLILNGASFIVGLFLPF